MRLTLRDIKKTFAAPVLRGIDLAIASGEIVGLVGENGAGKSTLANIVMGMVSPDGGAMLLDGKPHAPRSAREAQTSGIAAAKQELSLVDTLSVAENILLTSLPARRGVIRRDEVRKQATDLLATVGLGSLRPDADLRGMSLAQRQLIEFAKAIATPSRLLILDEPTAALTAPQADLLHRVVAERAQAGTSVLYISHRLTDVLNFCHRVVVLRDGELVRTAPAHELTVDDLIELMSGRRQLADAERSAPMRRGAPALVAHEVTTAKLPHPVSFSVHAGEVVGIAGLAGAGRTELLEALYGLAPLTTGTVTRQSGPVATAIRTVPEAVANGMGMVSEDRKLSGIFAGHSPGFSMTLAAIGSFARRGMIDWRREKMQAAEFAAKLRVKSAGAADITSLSGGNQQKILFARWLMRGVDVLLLDEPSRGVDVGSKLEIHREIRALAEAGCAVLVVSSEIEELTAISDRILVLSARRLVRSFEEPPFDTAAILAAAFEEHVASRGMNSSTRQEVQ